MDSSAISAIGYDPDQRVMRVQFKTGKSYDYPGVQEGQHEALIGAKSIGTHFAKNFSGRSANKI